MNILMHIQFLFILPISQVCIFVSTDICEPALLTLGVCYLYSYMVGLWQRLQ